MLSLFGIIGKKSGLHNILYLSAPLTKKPSPIFLNTKNYLDAALYWARYSWIKTIILLRCIDSTQTANAAKSPLLRDLPCEKLIEAKSCTCSTPNIEPLPFSREFEQEHSAGWQFEVSPLFLAASWGTTSATTYETVPMWQDYLVVLLNMC